MLNRNLDLDIDGYVSADFTRWRMCGRSGGVEIDLTIEEAANITVPHSLVEDVVGRKSKEVAGGRRTLDGIQTVSYCRIR